MSERRRLLVITYLFGPDGPVGGLRWFGLTKYLGRLGWEAVVLTAAEPGAACAATGVRVERCPRLWTVVDGMRLLRRLTFGQPPGWFPNGSRAPRVAEPRSLLWRLGREITAWLAFPDNSRGWTLRAALRARSLIRRFRPHAVVSSGPPHSAHLVAGMATIGQPTPWLIDLRDPWAGPFLPVWQSDRMLGSRTFHTLAPRLQRRAFDAAAGVIANTRQLADVLAAKHPNVRPVWIPNGVDPEGLPPRSRDSYPGLGIAHAGTLYAGRDLGPVVRALRLFIQRHPDAADAGAKLRIAGKAEGGHAQAFHDAVAQAGMERYVEVLGTLPRTQALQLLSRSRLAVVLAQQQELQVPAKLYESVAMGIPTLVLAPAGSAARQEATRLGVEVRDADDVEGIAGVMEHVWRNSSRAPCGVPITYEAIAPLVDRVLRDPYGSTTSRSRRA